MQIQNANLNFTSKNPVIRKGDDIARRINIVFPRVSESRVDTFKNINKFQFLKFNLREKTRQLRNIKSSKFDYAARPVQRLLAFLDPVKERRIGNCAETAQIAAISAKLNGINDAQIMGLRTKSGRKLDHAVLYVENGGKPYIIDPWIGRAGYVPDMLKVYTSEYRETLGIEQHLKAVHLKFTPLELEGDVYSKFLKKEISEEDKKLLLQLYPELLV